MAELAVAKKYLGPEQMHPESHTLEQLSLLNWVNAGTPAAAEHIAGMLLQGSSSTRQKSAQNELKGMYANSVRNKCLG